MYLSLVVYNLYNLYKILYYNIMIKIITQTSKIQLKNLKKKKYTLKLVSSFVLFS